MSFEFCNPYSAVFHERVHFGLTGKLGDSTSQRVVQQALDTAAVGRMTIEIAHRLFSIQDADRIYFIKNGVNSEPGTHDDSELLRRNGDYSVAGVGNNDQIINIIVTIYSIPKAMAKPG
ncbi:hypothetical protein B0H19DRAFT_1065277 [Mycena capillaripes]|nr:hypothetical protein B0H19DRAFT_1065277 [Mycena capillaripes]